jgi:hypothetical protein
MQVTEVDPRLSPEEHAAATRALEGVLKGGLAYDDERFHVFVDTPGPKAAFVLKVCADVPATTSAMHACRPSALHAQDVLSAPFASTLWKQQRKSKQRQSPKA